MKDSIIYLDSHATTPVDQDVLSEMLPYFTEHYGNGNHKSGWKTNEAVENARFQVSNIIGAKPSEIVFTSGATEAINIALLGLANANTSSKNHIVTQKTEHKAVLECIESLKEKDFVVTMLDVDSVGRIDLKELDQAVTGKTLAVAIMLANNEIGTVQPIKEIGEICKKQGAKFFCDITQGIGWHIIDMVEMNIDLAAMSAHKIYGPRGVGALFIRKSNPITFINPILFGGGQEKGLRPGTINVPAIVGFGKACEVLNTSSKEIYNHVKTLRNRFQNHLVSSIDGIQINGCLENRHPGNLNITIPNILAEQLKELLPNVMFSTTSACSGHSTEPSHVLLALQLGNDAINSSFRLGIGKFNTIEEIDFVACKIADVLNRT